MKELKGLSIVFVVSICATVFLFFIDSDPAYSNIWKTILEFTTATIIIFAISTGIYYLVGFIWILIKSIIVDSLPIGKRENKD